MVILHICGLNGDKSNGPTTNVTKNVTYSSKYEQTAFYNLADNTLNGLIDPNKIYLYKDYKNIKDLPEPFNNPDIVIFQSMYIKKFINIYKQLKKRNIPYIITPRGALTKTAQNKKKIKKILGNLIFFNKFIKNAVAINYLTKNEYEESKNFKIKDYFINGNGIEVPSRKRISNNKRNTFNVNFIGRIEWHHKGLDYLIEAINEGKKEFREKKFQFNLYGPDRLNSYSILNKKIIEYEIEDLVTINPPVFDAEKENVYINSDIFIHTSRLEGQPTAVLEALGYGIPIFVTPGTNLLETVKENNLGFTSKFEIKDIKNNLLKAYKTLKNDNNNISKNCLNYSKNNFDWNIIVKKNISNYKKRCIND